MSLHSSQEEYNHEFNEATERGWGKTTVFDLLRAKILLAIGLALPGTDGLVDQKTYDTMDLGGLEPGKEVENAQRQKSKGLSLRSILNRNRTNTGG